MNVTLLSTVITPDLEEVFKFTVISVGIKYIKGCLDVIAHIWYLGGFSFSFIPSNIG